MATQRSTPGVAPGQVHIPRDLQFHLEASFHDRVAQLAKRLRRAVPDLSRREALFLGDLYRPHPRYPMVTITRLTAITARSPHAHHREQLLQIFREQMIARGGGTLPVVDVHVAFDDETDAQHVFDKAQLRYGRAPTIENWRCAMDAGVEQLVKTQTAIDALAAQPPLEARM